MENLEIAFPGSAPMFREALSKAMFQCLGKNFFEFLNLAGASKERVMELVGSVEGFEHFEEAYKEGKGIICITGHIGCWELLGAYCVSRGYPTTVIARRLWQERLQRDLLRIRESLGVRTIDRDSGPAPMMNVLRRGEVLGVLIDQNTAVSGIYVPFFGRPAHTPSGVAKMACIMGTKIVPMAVYLGNDFEHDIVVLPPISPLSIQGSRKERVEKLTSACSRAIEELIRIDPKQWVWFHDRWRERDGMDVNYAVAGY